MVPSLSLNQQLFRHINIVTGIGFILFINMFVDFEHWVWVSKMSILQDECLFVVTGHVYEWK